MLAHATILRTVFGTSSKVIKTRKTEDKYRNNYEENYDATDFQSVEVVT